jgi:hypothetical protein
MLPTLDLSWEYNTGPKTSNLADQDLILPSTTHRQEQGKGAVAVDFFW